MIPTKESAPAAFADRSQSPRGRCRQSSASRARSQSPDLFKLAKETYTVPDIWAALNLPGEPKLSCHSPFREERHPSFSIFDDGRAWKDHGSGAGGDVLAFLSEALGDYSTVRDWLMERIGIDVLDGQPVTAPRTPHKRPEPPKVIQYPSEPVRGTEATWGAFSKHKGLSYAATWTAVHAGILRFIRVKGIGCFVVTDNENRAAEIRRLDGKDFPNGAKAYGLQGVDKSWFPGLDLLRKEPAGTGVFVCEGSTDLLAALGLYCDYENSFAEGSRWVPVAVLGAKCKNLCDEGRALIRGRRVRLCFDGDDAGREGADHWGDVFAELGCDVDKVAMPDGLDLQDVAGEIEPEGLFS